MRRTQTAEQIFADANMRGALFALAVAACGHPASRPAVQSAVAGSGMRNVACIEDPSRALSDDQRVAVAANFERARLSGRLGLLIVPSLNGERIDDLAARTFRSCELGNRGVLVVIAIKERESRIETGSSVDSIVTDERAHEILVTLLNPHLLRGDFYGGAEETLEAIHGLLDVPIPPKIVP